MRFMNFHPKKKCVLKSIRVCKHVHDFPNKIESECLRWHAHKTSRTEENKKASRDPGAAASRGRRRGRRSPGA